MNNIIYDPNYIPNQPIFINNQVNDERIIPFLGGAIIGGLGGAAIANNQGYSGYYQPYYQQPVYYYPNGYYYYNGYPMYQSNSYTTNNIKRS